MRALLGPLLLVGLAACEARGADTQPPVLGCPTWAEPEQVGTVSQPALTEASGLAVSRLHPETLWVHNDSGDGARLFGLGSDGTSKAVLRVASVEARDWEDLAAGPGPEGQPSLYVGDIGDNLAARDAITVYRIAEPTVLSGTAASPTVVGATALRLTYPGGARDAEALLVEPDGSLIIVTKSREGASEVYRAAAPVGATTALVRVGGLDVGAPPMDGDRMVTAGDLSADRGLVLLRTYLRTWVWRRAADESVSDAISDAPCPAPTPAEPQGEAVAFDPDGRSYWSISEGEDQPIWRVRAIGD